MGSRRAGVCAFGVVLGSVLMSGAPPLSAQEPSTAAADATRAPAAKKPADPARRVPDFFGKIGLTSQQKEEIYKIRGKRQAQVEALQKQITQLQAETIAECESVLNDSQKQLLNLRRDAAARAKKAKAAATESPVASKAAEKSSN